MQPVWRWNGTSWAWSVQFDVLLEPGEVDASYPDLNGYWQAKGADGNEAAAGMVLFETDATSFWATEVPHPRSWGSVSGTLVGLSLQAVDMRQGKLESGTLLRQDPFGSSAARIFSRSEATSDCVAASVCASVSDWMEEKATV